MTGLFFFGIRVTVIFIRSRFKFGESQLKNNNDICKMYSKMFTTSKYIAAIVIIFARLGNSVNVEVNTTHQNKTGSTQRMV